MNWVFPFELVLSESKLSFLRTSLRFHSALAILEPQIYAVVELFGAELFTSMSEFVFCPEKNLVETL